MIEMKYYTKEIKQKAEIMKKKGYRHHAIAVLLFIVGMFVSVSLTAHGKDINPQQAAKIAKKYVTLSRNSDTKVQTRGIQGTVETPYYIFNDARGRGFVIVSSNDEMGEVLAYSTERTLDTLNANPCVKLLLEGYRQTFEVLKEGKVLVEGNTRAGLISQTVSPLLKSKWGQSHPFNAKTGYSYSGCVATAVAQMMYYYQWPAQGRGKNEYNVTYYSTKKSADFSQSHYDWANMLPDYRYPVRATTAQEDAVALLMSDVGIASFMQYTPNASGTQGLFAYQALQKNFDYTAAYITRAVEGPSRFAEILRKELLNGCPVYLEGRPTGSASGHAWVADGFDKNGLFHMNFGWEGQSDAYYSLTALNLSQTGNEFQGKPLAFNRAIT
ncbi:C10 family peptidase, partial [Hoylesella saccharolytica]|uniref:C10 family peptidase n=1 Tax=Hoylesella saccharolytica TaxID=633701 RepID=UPI0036F37B66